MSLADILAAKKAHKQEEQAKPEAVLAITTQTVAEPTIAKASARLPSVLDEVKVNMFMRDAITATTPTAVELAAMQSTLNNTYLAGLKAKPFFDVSEGEALLLKQKLDAKKLKEANDAAASELFAQKIALARQKQTDAIQAAAKTIVAKMSLAEKMALSKANQQAAKDALAFADDSVPEIVAHADADKNAEITTHVEESHAADKSTFSLDIVLNQRQLMAKEFALSGKSYCFIGAAGTGKTTTQRSVAETLLSSGSLRTSEFKLTGSTERVAAPSIAFVAYTRRASANLARAIHKSPALEKALGNNIMTIHALLEFEPVTYIDPLDDKSKFRFEPQRHAGNPLDITHLVIEEASMVGLDLWLQLYDALPLGVQIIFIGDINQLPPVFGASILNYALVQLPVIELTEVYRNSGIVLENAHAILKGEKLIEGESYDDDGKWTGSVTIMRGSSPVQVGQGKMARVLGNMFKQLYDITDIRGHKAYDPDDCIILSPWNKRELGTDNLNSWIAQFLGENRGAVVHEIIAGFNKLYLAVGDRVMYNKQDGVIKEILSNGLYHGKQPQLAGADLSRFGVRILGHNSTGSGTDTDDNGDLVLAGYDNFSVEELSDEKGERKQQCSHTVVVELETGLTKRLSAVGDFSPQVFSLGYALTVHKAQGCEWRKVFLILHKDHAISLFRELFYTANTRAREEVVIIAKDDIIAKAIGNQRIKGDTLEDKIAYFNSGVMDNGEIYCTKG